MINLRELILETTRRCNLNCEHCLRGKAQNKDLSRVHLSALFEQLSGGRIDEITFTGGEPSLASDIIEQTVICAKVYQVEIGNFYIATNAVKVPDEFMLAITHLWNYCDDNEISAVHYSNDIFHIQQNDSTEAHKLEAFRFYSKKYGSGAIKWSSSHEGLLKQGNAKGFGINSVKADPIEVTGDYDNLTVDGFLYMNVNGDIINGCDWSYASQKHHVLCSVFHFADFLKDYYKKQTVLSAFKFV